MIHALLNPQWSMTANGTGYEFTRDGHTFSTDRDVDCITYHSPTGVEIRYYVHPESSSEPWMALEFLNGHGLLADTIYSLAEINDDKGWMEDMLETPECPWYVRPDV